MINRYIYLNIHSIGTWSTTRQDDLILEQHNIIIKNLIDKTKFVDNATYERFKIWLDQ